MNSVMMNYRFLSRYVLAALGVAAMFLLGPVSVRADFPDPPADASEQIGETQTAVLAGGCFWGMEGVFERLNGVLDVTSGYAGGDAETAHYEIVGTGRTGHAESVRVIYDPQRIGYGTLLKVFFSVAHDPTQLNYQGPDVGTQYRSAIFYADESQRRLAEEYIDKLNRSRVYRDPIVTKVVPLQGFYPAEEYHQDFMDRNPNYPYIVYWDVPKIEHLKSEEGVSGAGDASLSSPCSP